MSKSESEGTDKVGNETKDTTDRNKTSTSTRTMRKEDVHQKWRVRKKNVVCNNPRGLRVRAQEKNTIMYQESPWRPETIMKHQKRFPASRLCDSQGHLAASIAQAL